MQDLTPVGLDQDGTRLVLVSASGTEYAVPVDARLRTALRGDTARLGQVEMKMDSALRPRDIQARIRAGESPEEVADAAQTSVEAIMVFAGPVLAERAHVAQNAQRASLRRPQTESSAPRTLGEAAELFFAEHTLHDEDVAWDSWRRPDGRWVLVAAYTVAGQPRRAEFTHDLPGRYVVAENDEARVLTGEQRRPDAPGAPAARPSASRRLSPVPSQDELPLGDDAIELVRDRDQSAETGDPVGLAEGAEAADAGGATDSPPEPAAHPLPEPTDDTADADWLTPAAEPAGSAPEDDPADPAAEDVSLPEEPIAEPTPEDEEPTEVARSEKRSAARRKGRSSVPSWDEIMFGGGDQQD